MKSFKVFEVDLSCLGRKLIVHVNPTGRDGFYSIAFGIGSGMFVHVNSEPIFDMEGLRKFVSEYVVSMLDRVSEQLDSARKSMEDITIKEEVLSANQESEQ